MADVIVVGAGLSGLWAASLLHRAGLQVKVLEARERVGGRTLAEEVDGACFDLGGQWIGPDQTRLASLARELQVGTFPTWHHGSKVLCVRGETGSYRGSIPSLAPLPLLELHRNLRRLERMAAQVSPTRPQDHPQASAWDALSLEAWMQQHIWSRRVRLCLEAAVRVVFGAEPREVSLLHFLAYAAQAGGLLKLVEIERGAQQDRFVPGAHALSVRLAERLGEAVATGAPVLRLVEDAQGVRAISPRGTWRAERVILALPPALYGRIRFEPGLPPDKVQLAQRFPMGATLKIIATYDRPFWRERGMSGEIVTDGDPFSVTFDNTSHDGALPALVVFLVGDAARRWGTCPPALRRQAVLQALSRHLGTEALSPTRFLEKDWAADPWSGGCPTGFVGTGVHTTLGASLRAPTGRLHFAGTETARSWTGYLEGALEAGERAADEVKAALSAP